MRSRPSPVPQLQVQANPAAGLTNLPNWFWICVQQGQLDPGRGFSVDIPRETTWREEVEECQSGQVPGSDPPVLQVGPEGYGLLLAAPGAGVIVGAFGLGAVKSLRRIDLVMLIAMACLCLLITFGFRLGRLDAAAAAFSAHTAWARDESGDRGEYRHVAAGRYAWCGHGNVGRCASGRRRRGSDRTRRCDADRLESRWLADRSHEPPGGARGGVAASREPSGSKAPAPFVNLSKDAKGTLS